MKIRDNFTRFNAKRALLGCTVLTAVFASSAVSAQDVEEIPEEAEGEAETDDVVVVTGSRLRRDEFSSTSPIQVIDPEIGELQGLFNTASLVQSSSVAAGSAQITAAISSNFVTAGGPGAATVSLRGLGPDRTLVLLNSKRAGPAGTRGEVNAFDLNVIPQSVIGNIEILKDGASSVYGSDAIAGVVNLITKKDFDGLELDGFYSQPFEEGGEETRASVTYGKTFSRGHFVVAVDYYRQRELERRDRKYLDCAEEYIFDPTTGERADLRDPRTTSEFNFTGPNGFACQDGVQGHTWGHIWLYDYSYYYSPNGSNVFGDPPGFVTEQGNPVTPNVMLFQFDYDGQLAALGLPTISPALDSAQITVPDGFFPIGYNRLTAGVTNLYNTIARKDTVVPKTERLTVYADAALELGAGAEAYIEFLANRRETSVDSSTQFWNFGGTNNLGVPEPVFGFLNSDPIVTPELTGAALISPTAYTDFADSFVRVDYMRVLGGVRGDFKTAGLFDGWSWDIYSQYSRNDGKYTFQQVLNDANSGVGDLRTGSCVGTTTPISNRPCIDIDYNDPLFLAGQQTPAQIAFLFDTETGNTLYTQTYVEGFTTGDVFELPAGTVRAGFGAVWRRDKINDVPGPITLANNVWGGGGAGVTTGSSKTKEVFGEVEIPVFEGFTANGGVRYTDTSTAGDDVTWKAGFNWTMTDWITLRGTWGTSFRAPALFELFLADQESFLSQRSVDPCINWGANLASGAITQQLADNCAAQGVPPNHGGGGVFATVITGGGLGVLKPETSTAKTIGIVLTPPMPSEDVTLELNVDYFNIEVNGEIAALGAAQIVFGCLTSDFFPDDPLCDQFTRGQLGAPSNIAEIRASFLNINSQRNNGLDFTARYQHDSLVAGWDLDVLAQFTHQLKDSVALFEGTTVSNNGEDGEPLWVGDVNILATKNDWTLFWGMDFVGKTSDEGDFLDANGTLCPTDSVHGQFCLDLIAESRLYHSVSVTKDFEAARITLGVANLFDLRPPRVSSSDVNGVEINTLGQMPFVSQYDLLGRRVFLNATVNF